MLAILLTSAAGATLCLALGLVLRSSRRLGAADRHENLTLAVAVALLMPLLVLAMPVSMRVGLPSLLAPSRNVVEESIARGTVGPAATTASGSQLGPVAEVSARAAASKRSARVDVTTVLLAAWGLGTLVCALRLARAGWAAARMRRRARSLEGHDNVLVSAEVRVPMAIGVIRPSVVVPADAPAWSAEDLALTLAHERAHLARHDVAKQWAASIVCAIHWFNPLAWIVARAMATDREHAVDAIVLEGGARASSYASLLVRVAVRAEESALLAAFHAPAVGRTDLARRVEAVLAQRTSRASRLQRVVFAAVIVLAAVGVACSQGSPPSAQPPTTAVSTPGTRAGTPSAVLLERALGGESSLDAAKQAATEATLDALLTDDATVIRAHAIAMEIPSGLVVALAGRDRATGPTLGLERVYPPGSTVKALVVAAALDAGVLKTSDMIDGHGGSRELTAAGGKKQTLTDATPNGSMSLAKMLAVSSNVGASHVGERLGAPKLLSAFETVGLFTPIDGLAVAPSARPITSDDPWHHAIVAIGHDFSVSPLRVVGAFGALANGGELVSPRLRASTPRTTSHFVSPEAARAVTVMLESVVSDAGTGNRARVANLRVAGKTGTADVEEGVMYASFVGMFPAEAPRYVVLVGAETRTGTGGQTAAPRFASLVTRAFR